MNHSLPVNKKGQDQGFHPKMQNDMVLSTKRMNIQNLHQIFMLSNNHSVTAFLSLPNTTPSRFYKYMTKIIVCLRTAISTAIAMHALASHEFLITHWLIFSLVNYRNILQSWVQCKINTGRLDIIKATKGIFCKSHIYYPLKPQKPSEFNFSLH